MSEHDSELPDPEELFERLNREADSSDDTGDSVELPDPAELFQRMEQEYLEQTASHNTEDLPDPAELFRQIRQSAELADSTSSDQPGVSDPLPYLPDPDQPGLSDPSLPYIPSPDQPGVSDPSLPYIPSPDQPGVSDPSLPYIPSPDQPGVSDPSLPYIPSPDQPGVSDPSLPYIPGPEEPGRPQDPPSADPTLSDDFLKELKDRFHQAQSDSPAKSRPASPRKPDRTATSLPSPEELFRRMKAEREEAALNFESEPGSPLPEAKLPTPEELFRRMEEEYTEQTGSQLPELPDLDALKAELEAEERALLDPDVEANLAGPERFVETVSDNIFSREQPELFTPEADLWNEHDPEPELSEGDEEKWLPMPQRPPVPPPAPPQPVPPTPASPAPSIRPKEPEREPKPEPVIPDTPSPTGTVKVDPDELLEPPLKEPVRRRRRGSASYAKQAAEEADQAKKQTFKRFSRQKLAIFTRQMSVMLKSGIQLHMAVQFAAQSDPDLQEVLTAVMHKVESGYTFSAALGATSRTFDNVYVGLIQSGEMSGRLHEIMARLADALEREVELRKRLISVITYPSVLLMVCLLGTLGFMFFILPTLIPLFEELSVDLPLPTKILLGSRDAILPVLAASLGLIVLYFFTGDRIVDALRKRPVLQRRLSSIPFHIPVVGQVYDKIVTARVLYSLSTMLDVGITLNQALARTEVTAGNALVSFRLGKARMDLADGVGVTDCFRFNQLFSPSALYLISAGEESARLAEMFAFVAKIFDEDVEYALQTASSVLEPLIMVVMGVIVGFITIAAALPTIHLLQNFT